MSEYKTNKFCSLNERKQNPLEDNKIFISNFKIKQLWREIQIGFHRKLSWTLAVVPMRICNYLSHKALYNVSSPDYVWNGRSRPTFTASYQKKKKIGIEILKSWKVSTKLNWPYWVFQHSEIHKTDCWITDILW